MNKGREPIKIGENNNIWAFQKPDGQENSQYIAESVLKEGKSRFGWSANEYNNLLHPRNHDQSVNPDFGESEFLLQIEEGDWIVHINCPSYGRCLAAKVLSGYKWDPKTPSGDFRHYFDVDKKSVIDFERNDPLILKNSYLKFRRRKRQMKDEEKDSFIEALNRIIQYANREVVVVEEEEITSLESFIRVLSAHTKSDKLFSRDYLYRGLSNLDWKIMSTDKIKLNNLAVEENHNDKEVFTPIQKVHNRMLVESFKHDFSEEYRNSPILDYELSILAELRHYDAATALIDFSRNPFISLWFACQRHQKEMPYDDKKSDKELYYKEDTDGVVYMLNVRDKKKFIEINTVEQLQNYTIEKIFHKSNSQRWFYWRPPHLNKRIPAQSSCFVIGSSDLPIKSIKRIVIPHQAKAEIMKDIIDFYDIDIFTIFPDMYGFASANSHNPPYKNNEQYQSMLIKTLTAEIESAKEDASSDNHKLSNFYLNRGGIKLQFNQLDEADEDFDRAIEANNKNFTAYMAKGYLKHLQKNYDGAIKYYDEVIINNPKYAPAYHLRGLSKSDNGKLEEAINDFDIAISNDPKIQNAHNNRGVAKGKLGEHEDAIKDFNKEIELGYGSDSTYNNLFNAYLSLEKNEEALINLNKAIDSNPEDYRSYYNRGILKFQKELYKEALEDFNRTIKISTYENPNFYSVRGFTMYALEEYEDAIKNLDKAIDLGLHNSYVYYYRGLAKFELNEYKGSIIDLKEALKVEPDNKDIDNVDSKDIENKLKEAEKLLAEQKSKEKE